jgi:hypothetical protein
VFTFRNLGILNAPQRRAYKPYFNLQYRLRCTITITTTTTTTTTTIIIIIITTTTTTTK